MSGQNIIFVTLLFEWLLACLYSLECSLLPHNLFTVYECRSSYRYACHNFMKRVMIPTFLNHNTIYTRKQDKLELCDWSGTEFWCACIAI